ncbi:16S rRNA (cytosine(1402)-N(4))-methyltransferase RsmH [Patescibacteria group bacterium]
MSRITHIPVLLDEVLNYLQPSQNKSFVDGTVGQGGHAQVLLERILPEGRLLGIDRDQENLDIAVERLKKFGSNVVLTQGSYSQIKELTYANGFSQIDGILLDLGFSSGHIESSKRGFTFMADEPLDMRYDQNQELTAKEIVNNWSEEELAKIFRQLGEERNARQIAKAITVAREANPILTSAALAELVASVIGRTGKIHPATRVFQALRIATNNELGELEKALPEMVDLLTPGSRLVIISFHSLEDRIVKQFFKSQEGKKLKTITKKVVCPTKTEIKNNPRARSAKLRVAERK